jgi:hypothetical protein
MAGHSHLIDFPEALKRSSSAWAAQHALGAGGRARGCARGDHRRALAARDRGDQATALARIVDAMQRLAELSSDAGAPDAPMLRLMAERFRQAVGHTDLSQAKDTAEVMRVQSGSTLHPKRPR